MFEMCVVCQEMRALWIYSHSNSSNATCQSALGWHKSTAVLQGRSEQLKAVAGGHSMGQ